MKIKKLEGLIAAAHTAFNDDGSVNCDVIPRQAEMLVRPWRASGRLATGKEKGQ